MPKRFARGIHIFLLYWLCCFLIGVFASLISLGALSTSQFRVSKASAIVARGALFPYIQLSKLTHTTLFLAWEKALIITEEVPPFAQNLQILQKTYTQHLPLDVSVISNLQPQSSHLLSQWHELQTLISKSPVASSVLRHTKYARLSELLDQSAQVLQSGDLFLQFLSQQFQQDKSVNMLVLFENNMELRPTGGFMGSYSVLHLAKNEPITFEVQDIYVPDGQLTGHVDPPLPIQEAFQQGFWKLRDANWHPDFKESTDRIQWFFTQTGSPEFDGVVAMTFSPVQKLLEITGPLPVPDLGTTVTSENMYQILQRNNSQKFFPGSTQKRDTLSAFTTQLIIRLQHLSITQYFDILSLTKAQVEQKNILLSMKDPLLASHIAQNSWDGALKPPHCIGATCSQDYFSLFEANLGVNKSNCCVKRSVTIRKELDEHQLVSSAINLHYFNSGPGTQYQGVAGDYKTFVRFYFPSNTQVLPPTINGMTYTEYIRDMKAKGFLHPITSDGFSLGRVKDLQELGMWIVVPTNQELKVEVPTRTQLDSNTPYSLVIQKQPGTFDQFNTFEVSLNQAQLFRDILRRDVTLREK